MTTHQDHQMLPTASDFWLAIVNGLSQHVQTASQSSDGVLPMLLSALVVTSSKTASSTTSTPTQPVPPCTHSSAVFVTSCTTELSRIADAMSTDHSPSPSSVANSVSVLSELVLQPKAQKDPSLVTFVEPKAPSCSNSTLPHSRHSADQDSSLNGSSRGTSSPEAFSTPSLSPSDQQPQT